MSADLVRLLAVVAAVVVAAALLGAYLTAHRLDRLHIRTDLARISLVGVLARRHAVAGAVQRALTDTGTGAGPEATTVAERLSDALSRARVHPPQAVLGSDPTPEQLGRRATPFRWDGEDADRAEHAENALGLALAAVDSEWLPPDLAAELEDVSDRVEMARRFHNDAVRDTRALRERPVVRVLHLAGRAPMPDYVELVDPSRAGS